MEVLTTEQIMRAEKRILAAVTRLQEEAQDTGETPAARRKLKATV